MNKHSPTIIFAVSVGLVYWFADAVVDKYVLSSHVTFWHSLLHDSENHKFYYRHSVIFIIGITALFYTLLYNKSNDDSVMYRHLLDNLDDAVFIILDTNGSDTGHIVVANEVAFAKLGYTKEDMLQLSIHDIIDPEQFDAYLHSMETLKTGKNALFQTVLLRKDGSEMPVEINAHACQFKGKPACAVIVRDISTALVVEEDFREMEQQFCVLTERLIVAQEEERGRLSKELHDELGQNLIFLKMQVSLVRSHLPETLAHVNQECGKLLSHIDETIENVRRLSQDLNPRVLEEMGISSAIDTLVRESCELYKIDSLTLDLERIDDFLPAAAQLNLYRVFQESMTNIGKHAQATEVSVKVKSQDGQISIRIKDNGRGFDPHQVFSEKRGLGITTIKERTRLMGGRPIIQSHPGKGTEIILTIPLRDMTLAERGKRGLESYPHFISR